MSSSCQIQYLTYQQIDKTKWNACIKDAGNGLIYAYSFYLDHMASQWDGLVLNDYETVMPLTWNKKYGIYYLYQPFLTAQLGVFGKRINAETVKDFLEAVPAKFSYWDIYLNHANLFRIDDFNLYERKNFVLSLNRPYEELYKSYKENIQRNIKKADQAKCRIEKGFAIEKLIKLAWQQMKTHSKVSVNNAERFGKLYKYLYEREKAITYGIVSAQNELLASCAFFFSHNRAYYILVGNDPKSKSVGASHALIDAFIKDHAGENLVLDFEGSDIPGLALFYSGFDATEENYA